MLVGLSDRATMQVCHSNIEQSALLSSVQNHQSARRQNRICGRKTLVSSSKLDFVGKSRDKIFQSFNRINKIVMNLNIMLMSCTV